MINYILTFLFALLSVTSCNQSSKPRTSTGNFDTTIIRNTHQNSLVESNQSDDSVSVKKFDDIKAFMGEVKGKWESYYITKKGKIVGRDSLHFFDNGVDCESEGFIRFSNRKTDKEGMLNGDGKVVVPAEYNALTRVRNGMIIALKGAKKEYWEGGEHYSWEGGTTMLIDTKNKVLINNFKYDNNLNFYSLVIAGQPNPDTIRQNFKTRDGRYYSFIDYDKEFNNWLKTELLNDLTKENLLKSAFDEITIWKASTGWTAESKMAFIQRNFDIIRTKLLELNSSKTKYAVIGEDLNPFIYESAYYTKFYNNCGEAKSWIYPVMSIIISHGDKKDLTQDSFEFLRTNDGYKLLQVTIANEQIK